MLFPGSSSARRRLTVATPARSATESCTARRLRVDASRCQVFPDESEALARKRWSMPNSRACLSRTPTCLTRRSCGSRQRPRAAVNLGRTCRYSAGVRSICWAAPMGPTWSPYSALAVGLDPSNQSMVKQSQEPLPLAGGQQTIGLPLKVNVSQPPDRSLAAFTRAAAALAFA